MARIVDWYPCLEDRTSRTPIDAHYFYMNVWAFRSIARAEPRLHVDIGSQAILVGMLTAVSNMIFVDIRPLDIQLTNYSGIHGSILDLPFRDGSVGSLSCLHVIEHIGLGRYGDPLDPEGSLKACKELERVLAQGGQLYFALPVGRPRICFNAHRVFAPHLVAGLLPSLELIDFSGVDDRGKFREKILPEELAMEEYGCGLFHFRKRHDNNGRMAQAGPQGEFC